jgi:hypothetical protein
MSQGEPEQARRGCSVGVLLLSLATCILFCCIVPDVLWFPLGTFYEAGRFNARESLSGSFLEWNGLFVQSAVGLLVLINLAWMIYALCYWRTRPLPPDPVPPTIPDGASDHFMTPPQSPDVRL